MNWIFSNTGSKNSVRNKLKIQFVELDFSKLIFQKPSTDQQGDCCTAVMQLFVSLLRTQYPEFAYLWPRVGIFKFSAKIFPSSYQPELKLCVSTKTLPVFFVAKATPPHSLSKPSELQSEEQSSISKSTCERTCSMTYTVSLLIELDVSSKLKQITKLANHLLQI